MSYNNKRTSEAYSSSSDQRRTSPPQPPPEIFEMGRAGIEDDDSDDSLESVASRISAWTDGAENLTENNKDGLTDVQLDNRKSTHSSRGDGDSVRSDTSLRSFSSRSTLSRNSRSSGISRNSRSRRGPSLQAVTRASMSMEKRNSVRNMPRSQSTRHSRSIKLAYPTYPTPRAVPLELERVKESHRELDTEAQKFDSIASKYMFDLETEDETMSSVTLLDNSNKKRLMVFCYIATFAAFGFGVLVAYSMFQSGRPPAPVTEPPIQPPEDPSLSGDDVTVETIMPFLQKMSGPSALNNNKSAQKHALQWLQSKDSYTSSSTDQLVQRYILATFYYSTKGSTAWDAPSNNWLFSTDECEWDGVTCFDEEAYPELAHLVSKISLPQHGVAGSLPPEIGYLSHLRNLTLPHNAISGPLPSTIVKLTNLLALDLEDNKINGQLPNNMDSFKSLLYMHLSSNKLKGKIPPSVGNIATLQSINLKENDFTGIIPIEILNLDQLKQLNLAKNELVGVIPKDIDNLQQLQKLNVANNGLVGQIPDSIGNLPNLKELNLSYNSFNGYIPPSIGEIDTLRELDLISNEFDETDEMPTEICLLELEMLTADCFDNLEDYYVKCDCCTSCQ